MSLGTQGERVHTFSLMGTFALRPRWQHFKNEVIWASGRSSIIGLSSSRGYEDGWGGSAEKWEEGDGWSLAFSVGVHQSSHILELMWEAFRPL